MIANELRINNIVMVNYKCDRIGVVEWIQAHSISVLFAERAEDLVNGITTHPDHVQPIPLSPEILEKAGFEKKYVMCETATYYKVGEFLLQEGCFELSRGVHWLQNWHYFRTGIELNIQL